MASRITHKIGDTLTLPMVWSVDGAEVNLTGYAVTSQVRQHDELVGTLTCTVDPDQATNTGALVVSATATQTAEWPTGALQCDVRFEAGGGGSVTRTDTFELFMVRAVTRRRSRSPRRAPACAVG